MRILVANVRRARDRVESHFSHGRLSDRAVVTRRESLVSKYTHLRVRPSVCPNRVRRTRARALKLATDYTGDGWLRRNGCAALQCFVGLGDERALLWDDRPADCAVRADEIPSIDRSILWRTRL